MRTSLRPLLLLLAFANACSGGSDTSGSPGALGSPAAGGPAAPSSPGPPAAPCTHTSEVDAPSLPRVAPLELVDLGELGYCPEDTVTLRFYTSTQLLEVPAISASPLRFVAPLWIDEQTGTVAPVQLSVSIQGPLQAPRLPSLLEVDGLPAPQPLGQATRLLLAASRNDVADARAYLLLRGDDQADAQLAQTLDAFDRLEAAIARLTSSDQVTLRLPLSRGGEIALDRPTLQLLDALSQQYISGRLDTLGEQTASAGDIGRLGLAQEGIFGGWNLAESVSRGSVRNLQRFAGTLGFVLGGLALLPLSAPAVVTGIAVRVFAATVVAPVLSTTILNLSANGINADIWRAVREPVRHIYERTQSVATASGISSLITPTSPDAAAIAGSLETSLDERRGLPGGILDWFDRNGAMPAGPIFEERPDPFQPYPADPEPATPAAPAEPSTPAPSDPGFSSPGSSSPGSSNSGSSNSGGSTPAQPGEPEPGEDEEPEAEPEEPEPAPPPNVMCSDGVCFADLNKTRQLCFDFDNGVSWYLIGGARIDCGDFTDSELVIACDERADEACAE